MGWFLFFVTAVLTAAYLLAREVEPSGDVAALAIAFGLMWLIWLIAKTRKLFLELAAFMLPKRSRWR